MQRLKRLTNQIISTPKYIINKQSSKLLSTQNISSNEEKKEESVLIEEISGNYLVTLNRKKALNSLNIDMINILTPFYEKLIKNKKETTVIMIGAGDKAFCAGGDVRKLYDLGINGEKIEKITEFFKLEYNLDNLLGTLPNYVHNVCILNGITMGGGVGLSVHGKYRIATNNTLFAMPETGIGFYTDVGASYFLSRLIPKGLGLFLALNGYRLKGCDVLHAGIATHFIKHDNINNLINDLLYNNNSISTPSILSKYAIHYSKLSQFTLKDNLDSIQQIFNFDNSKSIEDIIINLEKLNNDFGSNTVKQLLNVSPTSLKVVYRALKEGENKNLRQCLDMEFQIVTQFMKQHDFYEGIRAQLVDKDRNPKWNPSQLKDVKNIDNYFPNL